MRPDELLAEAHAYAAKQMADSKSNEEHRLIRAYIAGMQLGAKIINSQVIANLALKQASL
jgi:hypothetical protein